MNASLAQEVKQIEIRGCISKHKKSQYFQAILQYKDKAGFEVRKSRSTKMNNKTEAYRVMLQMIEEEQTLIHTESPGTLLVDFLKYWLDEVIVSQVESTTHNGYTMNIHNHIIPYFKSLKLRLKDVRPVHIQRFLDDKSMHGSLDGKPLRPSSVQKLHANLKTAFDYAMSQELVEKNVARMAKVPKGKKYEAKYYTVEQIGLLWKACKGSIIEPAVFLASIYGFRRGEVMGLRWNNVDFRSRMIRIYETRTRGKTEIVKGTKNVASCRVMPMMNVTMDYLKRLKKQQDESRDFLKDEWIDSNYVIADELGKPLDLGRLQKHFKKILKENGLPDIRFHDLRHSVATYLLEIGIPIEEVSAWLGHSSITTTAKVYAHVNIGIRKNAAKVLDKMFGYEEKEIEADVIINIESAITYLFEEE